MAEKQFYPAVFEPEEVGYSVFVPDIPGCMTQGETLPEALEMAEDAIGLMLEDVPENGMPQASDPSSVKVTGRQFVMMVPFDKLAYDKKYNARAVKKTVSIPAWMNELALKKHVNFSHVLQNALRQELQVS